MEFYDLVDEHDWDGLKALILAGHKEDMSKYSYKNYPLIFDIIHAKDPASMRTAISCPASSTWPARAAKM